MSYIVKVSAAGMLLVSIIAVYADESIQSNDNGFSARELMSFFRPKMRNGELEAGEVFFFDESVKDKDGVSRIMRYYQLKCGSDSVIVISTLSAGELRDQWLGDSNLNQIVMDAAKTLDSIQASELDATRKSGAIERGSYYPIKSNADGKQEGDLKPPVQSNSSDR